MREDLLEEVARRTEGFSSADLQSLCREAAMAPMRRLLDQAALDPTRILALRSKGQDALAQAVRGEDLIAALEKSRSSVAAVSVTRYEAWDKEFGNS